MDDRDFFRGGGFAAFDLVMVSQWFLNGTGNDQVVLSHSGREEPFRRMRNGAGGTPVPP